MGFDVPLVASVRPPGHRLRRAHDRGGACSRGTRDRSGLAALATRVSTRNARYPGRSALNQTHAPPPPSRSRRSDGICRSRAARCPGDGPQPPTEVAGLGLDAPESAAPGRGTPSGVPAGRRATASTEVVRRLPAPVADCASAPRTRGPKQGACHLSGRRSAGRNTAAFGVDPSARRAAPRAATRHFPPHLCMARRVGVQPTRSAGADRSLNMSTCWTLPKRARTAARPRGPRPLGHTRCGTRRNTLRRSPGRHRRNEEPVPHGSGAPGARHRTSRAVRAERLLRGRDRPRGGEHTGLSRS